ncbi:MAG: hypothetical protein JWQ66_850 [Mucilaginibacter sp.]|nr:hypothetical protein [Mucilaginibacter sp.]
MFFTQSQIPGSIANRDFFSHIRLGDLKIAQSKFYTLSLNLRFSKNPPISTTINATAHDRKNPPMPAFSTAG